MNAVGATFYRKRRAGQDLDVIYVREGLDGSENVLIDPHPMSDDHTVSVELREVSEDGALVIYAVRDGGVDEVSLRILDVDSGEDLPDVLPEGRYGEVNLVPDKTGMFYERYGDVTPRVMYHEMGSDPSDDKIIFGDGYERHHIPVSVLSDNGRWLLVHVIEGSSGPTEMHIKDIEKGTAFVTVIADGVSESWGEFIGDRLVITTNLDAPNKRVVIADPASPTVAHWQEVIPEHDDVVIQAVRGMGRRLMVSYLKDVQPRVAIHEVDGAHVREIEFDAVGSIGGGVGRWNSNEAFFTFETFHVPRTIYRFDIERGDLNVWSEVELPVDADSYTVEQQWFQSKDGTEVPMFVVFPKNVVEGWLEPYPSDRIRRF